jgi:Nucleotidyltransferase domain
MAKVEPALTEFVRAAIEKAGLRLDDIADRAREIIVFGSRAAGVHSPHSDLDLLLVSADPGRRLKSSGLDIVWVRPETVDSHNWRGSELAGHVAAYGRWLDGPDDWKAEVFTSPTAIQKKQRQLADRIQALEAGWRSLAPTYRRRLFTLIRRDLQRLELLRQARPVSPTPLLDRDWERIDDPIGNLVRLLKQASDLSDRDKAHFASHAAELLSRTPVPT